jgi:hypothetical protein
LVCGLIAAIFATGSLCRAGHPTSRPAAELLAELGSADASVREGARIGLMRLKREELPKLRDAMAKAQPLRPPQALMLRQIVQEIYLSGEPYENEPLLGFMGVLMSEASMQADFVPDNELPGSIGVIVSERIPGFCAARKLLDGDVILGVASPVKAFKSARDLQETIGSLRPGTTVRLLVLRWGQVIELDLTLDAHPVQNTSDAIDVLRAKRQRKFDVYWNREFEPLLRPPVG